jgi:hypothetical protein
MPAAAVSCKGFGEDYVELDRRKTGSTLYLHLLWKRVRNSKHLAL